MRESTRDLLCQLGVEVTVAIGKDHALDLVARGDVDLVLSDVGLGPDGDGVSLQRELARLQPRLPVVLMSGLPSDLLAQRYGVSPSERLLRKPFALHELRCSIGVALA